MAARASFSRDSTAVSMPLPNSILLKDYLVDDLSSCSSNGFRSYPRHQCCTKVRYLIEIDLNIRLPPHKQFLKINSKPKRKHNSNPNCSKSKMNLRFHKASKAVVNVFKKFHFSGSGSGSGSNNRTKPKPKHIFLHFWKQTRSMNRSIDSFERFNSFHKSIQRNDNMNMNMNNNNIFTTLTTTTTAEMKTSGSNSNSFTSSDSYFTATTNSSTPGGCSNIILAQNDIVESEQLAPEKMNTEAVTVVTASNAKKKLQGEEKDIFSPISVIDFPCDRDNDDEEDEVTSPYQHSPFYAKECKQKLMSKAQRTKGLARLNPVRLEDRITLSESRTRGSILESSLEIQREVAAEKNAIALLQLLKATMSSHDLSKSSMMERVLLEFFSEQFIEGSLSNYVVLQEAKDWINGQTNDILEYQYDKLTCIKKMEKGVKWLEYNEEETREVVSELECEVFTYLVEEMLLEFYL